MFVEVKIFRGSPSLVFVSIGRFWVGFISHLFGVASCIPVTSRFAGFPKNEKNIKDLNNIAINATI